MIGNTGMLGMLVRFARTLGWRNLRRHVQIVGTGSSVPRGTVIVWYTSGHYDDIALQINERPDWRICVYAIPYRIWSGWHSFSLCEDPVAMGREVARLDEWTHRRWFANRESRARYRCRHPECDGYDWDRIAAEGPPSL